MPLKLCTFNCRGLQDYCKRRKVFHYMRSIDSDIIFLQETHSAIYDEKFWKTQWGEHAWFCSYSSNSRGVAILIRKSVKVVFDDSFCDPEGRFLILSVKMNDLPVLLVNVYAPNHDDPDFFLDVFAKIDQFNYTSLIVGGDFNAVLGPLDYQGGRPHHSNSKASDMISILMEELDLLDVWRHFHPAQRQCSRHQVNPKVLSRLDFILVSNNLIDNCLQSKILPGVHGHPVKGRGF